jgi:hypothetical protein
MPEKLNFSYKRVISHKIFVTRNYAQSSCVIDFPGYALFLFQNPPIVSPFFKLTLGTFDTSMEHPEYGRELPKYLFTKFCYLIRVEHEKGSKM